MTFFPTNKHFPEVKLEGHLHQAASGIIKILTQPLSTTTPSLESGDPVRNTLVALAAQSTELSTYQLHNHHIMQHLQGWNLQY